MPPLTFPSNEVLNNFTEEQLSARYLTCQRWQWFAANLPFIWCAVVTPLFASVVWWELSQAEALTIYIMLGFIAYFSAIRCHAWTQCMRLELQRLTPMDPMTNDLSQQALHVSDSSEEARAWARKVLESGRRLRAFDLDEMRKRFMQNRLTDEQAKNVEALKRLEDLLS